MTMIEAGQNYIQKLSEQNSRRLDEHDEQNKITYQLVEQIKAMKEDLIEMNKINWKVRFNKKNVAFLARFAIAILMPVLAYQNLKLEDLTTFETLGKLFVSLFSNPYLIGLTFVNAFNLIPDPTTAGLGDSEQALTYEAPKES